VRVIAIDGPAGAGKSTVARQVSAVTGLRYLDTGAMYRCVALAVRQTSTDPHDAEAVGAIARRAVIVIERDAVKLNGSDVTTEIRSGEINGIVSIIAAHTPVRDAMREQQRRWIHDHQGGVVEGRDIGTVVFPDAVLKVFLTASPEVRAIRRVGQNGGDIQVVAASIAERDHLDSTRTDSPLKPSTESVLVDSSHRSIEDVVAEIVAHFEGVDHGCSRYLYGWAKSSQSFVLQTYARACRVCMYVVHAHDCHW
jgi:CMP/dCMP kinase